MRAITILAALLAGLLYLEGSIEATTGDAALEHRPMIEPEERTGLQLTGFALKLADESFVYRRHQGDWRCVSAYGAIANPRRVTDLTRAILTRTATLRACADTPESDALFGFDEAVQVDFFRAEEGESPLSFFIASKVRSPNGASIFVRRAGSKEVWELDAADIDPSILRKESNFPPLMDRRLTAGCELNPGRGILRAFLDFEGGAALELRPESDGGQLDWSLSDGVSESKVLPYRLAGWLAFLQQAPYAGFGNPAELEKKGLNPPRARVTLFPPEAKPIELVLGDEVDGDTYLLNKTSGMLLLLPKGWSELVAPSAQSMTVAEGKNPWERWLR